MAQENNTSVCPKHTAEDGPSLLQNGDLVFQAHHVGWIVASFFTIIAVVTSAWLMSKHLQWYTNKHEQRYIVRILLLVPVYAIISLLSYFFWNHSTPLLLIRDGYESTVLTAFFYLLLCYLSPDETEQKALFLKKGLSKEADSKARLNGEKVKTWVFPLGSVKWKPSDGLYFLQWMKWGVLQYCVIRPLTTLIAVALEYAGLYCEASWGPGWGHVYLTVIVSISVTIAMYCLIQLYVVVSEELAPQRPLLKLFAIKAVVFLTFWQASLLSVLSMLSVIKDTKYMTAEDINIGIGALLETFEMMLFAFLHIRAFTYKVYRPHHHQNPNAPRPKCTPMLRSFLHAMDFRETFREIWQGWKYMWAKMRGREPPVDQGVKRLAHYESAFGKSRTNLDGKSAILVTKHTLTYVETSEKEFATLPDVHLDVAAEERVERQWLGLGDEFVYGLHREKSDDLEVQIERELERRGYGSQIPGRGHIKSREQSLYDHRPQRSWWRNVYDRISQSGQDVDDESDRYSPVQQPSNRRRHSKKRRPHRPGKDEDGQRRLLGDHNQRYEFDDPPPPSLIRQSRGQPQHPSIYHQDENGIIVRDDILSPLSVYTDHRSSHVHRQQPRDLASPPPPSSRHGSKQHRSSRRRDSENRPHSPPPRHDPNPNISHQMSPSMVRSADSLFGRVFPPSTGHGTSLGHGQNTPTQESHDHNIGLAGERSTRQAHVDAASTVGITVEIVDEVGAPEMSHHRESAFHRPNLMLIRAVLPPKSLGPSKSRAKLTPLLRLIVNHHLNARMASAGIPPRCIHQLISPVAVKVDRTPCPHLNECLSRHPIHSTPNRTAIPTSELLHRHRRRRTHLLKMTTIARNFPSQLQVILVITLRVASHNLHSLERLMSTDIPMILT
ncbi:DUF300-domain-containing protein [Hymenopellis radicata]|nr:DUF300-domain-containing protein [Hymenopellis radicata]